MELVFLKSSNGVRLTKTVTPSETRSYPNVRNVTSVHHTITADQRGLDQFESYLRSYADDGHCLLKGKLKQPLIDESRAGSTDRLAYCEYLVFDLDGVKVPGFANKQGLTSADLIRVAEQVIISLPPEFHEVSYIAQASSSLGLKGDRVSMHIYMLLTIPLPVKTIKNWFKHINLQTDMFAQQITLSANGQSLRWPLDPSVADNSKLIFIAPPDFTDASLDPFATPDDRIVKVDRGQPTIDLAAMLADLSPQKVHNESIKLRNELRKAQGLGSKPSKTTNVTLRNESVEVITDPDKMSISIIDDSAYPFVRCNINGGDSGGYYFNHEDPTYMFNFKDEPIFEIEKADKDFYDTLVDRFADKQGVGKHNKPLAPVVLRDFYTDCYYNGVYNPNTKQFTDEYPLTPTTKNSVESFMRSHGRPEPDFIPDARVVFEPASAAPAVQFDSTPYYVNMYRRSKYMLNASVPLEPLTYGTGHQLVEHCPRIYNLIHHMLGNGKAETEHFINWLAHIYQSKSKSMTAWILGGVPGTGKGLFVNKVLKPLFGFDHVVMKALENIEEQYNLYMRTALFLVVDEFRMTDAKGGAIRIADKLKNQITEPTLTIRAMRSNQVELPSFTNFLFLSNRPDAVKIETGDRRYNVAPRQEHKLEDIHPELIKEIPLLETELRKFAGTLETYLVDERMARVCMNNTAKNDMRSISMSVFDEFCEALCTGKLEFFNDVLEIEMMNTFEANRISSSHRFVKTWIADGLKTQQSVIPIEHLRVVYHVLTETNPQIALRQFSKMLDRNGLKSKPQRNLRTGKTSRGIRVDWTTHADDIQDMIDRYFDEPQDKALLSA